MSNPLSAIISANMSASNFYHLTRFICHLFEDGPFRTVHILQDSGNLPIDFHSKCFEHILLQVTDIRRPFSSPWNDFDNPNNVLQLISFDPDDLARQIDEVNDYLVLYRIFIFSSSKIYTLNAVDKTLLFRTRTPELDSRTLILHYNETSVSVFIGEEESDDRVSLELKPIFTAKQDKFHRYVTR